MPHPAPDPLNLPISHTFLQTMYVQMQRKTEGLGQIYTRVMLCGQHIGLDYDKQKRTITCQLKPIISIRLQLQVTLWVPFWSLSEDGTRFWEGLFQTDIQCNCNFSTAIFSVIVIPTLIALKHLIAMSSRWPRGPLVILMFQALNLPFCVLPRKDCSTQGISIGFSGTNQSTKSLELSNGRAFQIFECRLLSSKLKSGRVFKHIIFMTDNGSHSATGKLWAFCDCNGISCVASFMNSFTPVVLKLELCKLIFLKYAHRKLTAFRFQ